MFAERLDNTEALDPDGQVVIELILDVPSIIKSKTLDAVTPKGLFEKRIGRKGHLIALNLNDGAELTGIGRCRIGRRLHRGEPAEPHTTLFGNRSEHPDVLDRYPGDPKILMHGVFELENPRQAPGVAHAIIEAQLVRAAIVVAQAHAALHRVVGAQLQSTLLDIELLDVEGLRQT